ncbi:MAG TPA: NADP-dependent malic enzyme [candidate division Zixibacteria bacterium]|nr:NADP-dependent malic enzyme [candidate division Zixibacteria bacterium]
MTEKKLTKEELLAKAKEPAEIAMKLHPYYQGKIQVVPKCSIWDFDAFGIWYTPGVAAPCKAINANKDEAFRHTNKANSVAVVSDGTRVLGLGDIGPEAAMPVMEGKSLLFKYLGGVDAVPICLDTKDPDEIIRTVKLLQPSFGGINLEDFSKPKCYRILETLRKEMEIPVWHDDAQGTAAVILAGVFGALEFVGKEIDQVKVAMLGVGSANTRTAYMLIAAGMDPKNITMCDSKGILTKDRQDIIDQKDYDTFKYDLAQKTNGEGLTGDFGVATEGADVLLSASKSEPGTIKTEWIKHMASDSIVFACANPLPEIWPWDAKEAGAKVVGTGRSDFPNQVNNSLGFPGIFRGTLDVQAKTITDEMCIAAAKALAEVASKKGLSADYITPKMSEWEVYPLEATRVGMKAIEQGIARIEMEEKELYKKAEERIKYARDLTHNLMETKFIKPRI